MPFFSFGQRRPETQLLGTPPPRRLSTPAGDRLATILENNPDGDQPINRSGNARNPNARHSAHSGISSRSGGNASLPRASAEPMPPPYTAQPQDGQSDDARFFAEKDAQRSRFRRGRGGWGRFVLIAVVLLIVLAIALGVGLGVGLKNRSSSTTSDSNQTPSNQSNSTQAFPLGEYSFVTALRNVSTSCTSNAATFRCFPYSTFSGNDSADGMAILPWILSRTNTDFATNTSGKTDARGIPANVTLSSGMNPFSWILDSLPLTYINDNNNPRYILQYTGVKNVSPSAALTSDNVATSCFFNQTMLYVSIYLSNGITKSYPGPTLANSSQVAQGSYPAWPYAIEISEMANGGANVPDCHVLNNGVVGGNIGSFVQQPTSQQCSCNYRNFG